MRLDLKALATTLGTGWGAGVFVVGLAHLLWPTYGTSFLELVASVYPGYQIGGFGSVIIGTLYAVVDGAVCGAVLGWIYNAVSAGRGAA